MRPLTPRFVCYDTRVCAGFFTLISHIDPKVKWWCSHLQMRNGPQRKGPACREPGTEGGVGLGTAPLTTPLASSVSAWRRRPAECECTAGIHGLSCGAKAENLSQTKQTHHVS